MKLSDIREFEARAARTWPAEVSVPLKDWLLRASGGTTKRANSVLTAGDGPQGSGWLAHIEEFYAQRSLTPTFQVTDGSPTGLDELLSQHGYVKDTPCMLMTAQTAEVIEAARQTRDERHKNMQLSVSDQADTRWLDDFIRLEQFPAARLPFYQGLCGRMPAGTHFYSLKREGETIAVATLVGEEGWGGIMNVAVDESLRGQGIGKLLMDNVAEHSRPQQIDRLYLQVMTNNEPACRLYMRLNFVPAYTYHYRVKP